MFTADVLLELTSTLVDGPPVMVTVGLPCTLNELAWVGCITIMGGVVGSAVRPHTEVTWTGVTLPCTGINDDTFLVASTCTNGTATPEGVPWPVKDDRKVIVRVSCGLVPEV
jgi:hypothetical protein